MRISRITLVVLLLCASASFAQVRLPGVKNEQVQTIVRDFCRQDFLGARLSPEGWSRIKSLTTWKDNPAWKSFRIVLSYEQSALTTSFHGARVTVTYMTLGRFDLGSGYAAESTSREVEFRLKEVDGQLRIDETDPEMLEPQVSKQTALQWLQARQKTATDPADKVSIETALKALAPQK